MEGGQEVRGTEEEDEGHAMTHMGGQVAHQKERSEVEAVAVAKIGKDEGDGGAAILWGRR